MPFRRLLCAPLACGALILTLAAPAAAAPVATPGGTTQVREYQGTVVFSQFDAAERVWRLAVRRPGAAPEVLPDVRPADREFNADIGPDSEGRPQLVYERCDETCDLFVYSLASGTGERAVRNANDPSHHDVAPTLWRGRIAWARIYGEQRDRKVVVYTKTLTAPRSRPSTRLPGVPQRRCGDVDRRCAPTLGRAVDELELWGDNLAQTVRYECAGCSGFAQAELRHVRVSTRRASQVAFQVVGLSGQSLVGPSFHAGTLAWYRACLGDPAACEGGRANPFRFDLSDRTYTRGAGGPIVVHGFADAGSRLFETVDCNEETAGDFNTRCRIEEVEPPAYERVRAPLR